VLSPHLDVPGFDLSAVPSNVTTFSNAVCVLVYVSDILFFVIRLCNLCSVHDLY